MRLVQMRAYEGRNIYSHYPVVAMLVDLGRHDGHKSSEIPGFNSLLLEALPGLAGHHCATGRPGGFLRRLEDGTFLGHVIEHVALELQSLAGWSVVYGRTRQAAQAGTYNVVFECGSPAGGREAGRRAVEIVRAAAAGRQSDVARHLEAIRKAAEADVFGPSTAALVAEAQRRGIPVRRFGTAGLLVLGSGSRQRRLWATVTSRTSCPAVDLAGDKVLTKEVLSQAGLPVPPGRLVAGRREALKALAELGPPVVVKPATGNQGRGVSLGLSTPAEVRTAFGLAAAFGSKVLVERHIPGRHYRLLVVGGRLVAAAERLPAAVTGDGRRTVRELVDEVNRDPRRGEGHDRPLTRITIDPVAVLTLSRQGLAPDSVPEAGRTVILRENANLSTGGTARDVTGEVHQANASLAARAARLIGLDVAGIDIVTPDISRPLGPAGGAIIEVNASPGLRMHLHPTEGTPRAVAGPILDSLFEGSEREPRPAWLRRGPWGAAPGRIPIVAVTGTNGKTTVCRLVAHILATAGLTVGLASTDGAWVAGERVAAGDCAGPRTAAALLNDPAVEAAVLETARGGLIRDGLAFDRCDVGLITNVSHDHEGQDGLERLEDVAYVKALVIESVASDGQAILNADDPFVHGLADRASGEVVYFSRTPGNLVVKKHLVGGGRAVYLAGDGVVAERAGRQVTVVSLGEVPLVLGGLLSFQVENVVAAVAASWTLGVPLGTIRRALRTFGRPGRSYESNPGRFQVHRLPRGPVVVLDYGHNQAAYAEALAAARRLARGDLVAVIGAPGDRRDEHLVEMGRLAARGADRLLIKEDVDTRGRARGEVASLFLRGVLDTGFPEARVEVVLDERSAVERAISRARPGDWVLVFFEKAGPLLEVLTGLGARPVHPARLGSDRPPVPGRAKTRRAVASGRGSGVTPLNVESGGPLGT
ncbi:MAG: cyanophycin synthetase [Bacillota bacterium]